MIAYSLIMISAVVIAGLLARKTQSSLGLQPIERWGIRLGAFCGAMIGAKLPFVFSDWREFLSGAAWFANGKTILLGMVGGYVGVEIAKWVLDVRARTGDSFVIPVAAGIAIGRLGCFVGGCCYGTPTTLPWGVVFSSVDSVARHPTQLYESIFHGLCALAFSGGCGGRLCRGNRIKVYMIVYGLYRFLTEFIRPEAQFFAGGTGYQWASVIVIFFFAWLWWRDARSLGSSAADVATT